MLATLTVADRLTLVDEIGTPSEGGTLAGLNVASLPAGALVYVEASNRFYVLRKDLPTAVIPDVSPYRNVVAAIGSSAQNGYFVACSQQAEVTLVGGQATALGFDLSRDGNWLVGMRAPGGSIGDYVLVTPSTDAAVSVQSEDSDDASTYFILYTETP